MRTRKHDLSTAIEENLERLGQNLWRDEEGPARPASPSGTIERALGRFVRDRKSANHSRDLETMSPDAFRAVVAQRLTVLERECADIRTRLNGLFFVTLGAALTALVDRLFG